ncbi:hypothetical protein [Kitasatospora terrestris]
MRKRSAPSEPRPRPRPRVLRALIVPVAAVAGLVTACAPGPAASPSAASPPSTTAAPPSTSPAGATSPTAPATPAAPTPTGTFLVTDFGADTVTFVDPQRGAIGSVEVGTAPYGLAVDGAGRAWVATAEGVAVVDTASRTRLDLIPYRTATGRVTTGEYRGGGMGIALSPDGRRAYVGVNVPGGDGVLEVVDTAARKVTDTVPVGRRPFDVDVSPDGATVYATDHDSFDVTAVPTATLVPRRIEVAPYGTEGGLGSWLKPHYTAVRPSDGRLLLPFEGERLAVVDPATGRTTIEPMTAHTHQHGATLAPDGRLLVVGTGPIDPATDAGPSLTVRNPDGTERLYPLDGPHETVTTSPDGRTAYVTGGFTRDGYWNGLTVIDLASGDTHRLPAGTRPLSIAVL